MFKFSKTVKTILAFVAFELVAIFLVLLVFQPELLIAAANAIASILYTALVALVAFVVGYSVRIIQTRKVFNRIIDKLQQQAYEKAQYEETIRSLKDENTALRNEVENLNRKISWESVDKMIRLTSAVTPTNPKNKTSA